MPLPCFNGNPRLILLSQALIWLFSRFCAFEWTAATAESSIGLEIFVLSLLATLVSNIELFTKAVVRMRVIGRRRLQLPATQAQAVEKTS